MLNFDKNQYIPVGVTKNMISVQEVIDILQSIANRLPEGRTLSNTPFCIRNGDKKIITFCDKFKDKLVLLLLGSYATFLNLIDADAFIISTKGDLYTELKELKKENKTLKNKLSTINKLVKNND